MIKIDDKFFIDADSNSYTLKEKDKIQDKIIKCNTMEEAFKEQLKEKVWEDIKEIKKQTEFVKKLNLKV